MTERERLLEKIRKVLEVRSRFFRKSLSEKAECCVCGIHRLSLLKAVPYGEGGMKHCLLYTSDAADE